MGGDLKQFASVAIARSHDRPYDFDAEVRAKINKNREEMLKEGQIVRNKGWKRLLYGKYIGDPKYEKRPKKDEEPKRRHQNWNDVAEWHGVGQDPRFDIKVRIERQATGSVRGATRKLMDDQFLDDDQIARYNERFPDRNFLQKPAKKDDKKASSKKAPSKKGTSAKGGAKKK